MKKLLIATSAVVGLGLVSADFAAAQLETSFSGLVRVRLTKAAKGNEGAASATNYAQKATIGVNRAQLQWDAKGTSDSGLTYGARIRLRPTGTDGGRHLTYVYFGGGFGQVTVGNQYGVVVNAFAGAANAASGSGGVDGQFSGSTGTTPVGGVVVSMPSPVADGAWGRFDGVNYSSPDFGGVTVNVDLGLGDGNKNNDGNKGRQAVALQYSGAVADGSVNAVLSYVKNGKEANLTTAATVNGAKAVMLAADATFGAVSVGANYISRGKSGGAKTAAAGALKGGQKAWLASAKYSFGPGSVSLGYGTSKATAWTGATAAAGTHTDRTKTMVLSAGYTVAPGWSVYGDIYRHTTKTGRVQADTSASSTTWVVGTNVAF